VKGAEEFGITSDDLFWLDKSPGKTLVVGASYVALECAGFLTKLGCDVTLMVRSIFLRGYDQDMAERVGSYMEAHGTKIYRPAIPLELSKSSSGKIKVLYKQTADNVENTEEFDTVLFAIGRKARTETLNIEKIGVSLAKNKKIITNQYEQTEVPNIYAIGDVAFGKPELTPVAIMAGRLLASRLMRTGTKLMDYTIIPSCVYTPLEYGFCGLTEEGAKEKYGKEQIIVYHSGFKPLEWNFLQSRESDACYIKLIVENATDRILGYHYLGPNAGEVVQGYASALMMGVTKEQWDSTVKIHPTCSEEMLALHTVKGTGANAVKTGC
jgi:thioredoxin reductase (NADPH)